MMHQVSTDPRSLVYSYPFVFDILSDYLPSLSLLSQEPLLPFPRLLSEAPAQSRCKGRSKVCLTRFDCLLHAFVLSSHSLTCCRKSLLLTSGTCAQVPAHWQAQENKQYGRAVRQGDPANSESFAQQRRRLLESRCLAPLWAFSCVLWTEHSSGVCYREAIR